MSKTDRVIDQIIKIIHNSKSFLITAHINPDGDTVGTQLAVYFALKAMGKEVTIVNRDKVPVIYKFLPSSNVIETADSATSDYDTTILFECGIIERSGLKGIKNNPNLINIDHHPGNSCYGLVNWVDLNSAAVGIMAYELIKQLPVNITPQIATCLYTAIITDTGSFQFSNTSSAALKACGELAEKGINPSEISQACFENQPFRKMKLLGFSLSTLEMDSTGQIAWMHMPYSIFTKLKAGNEDTDGLVNYPRSVKNVKIALFFKEKEPGVHRVSMRSKGDFDVSSVAKFFNGGGHKHASGCTLEGSFEEVKEKMLRKIRQHINN